MRQVADVAALDPAGMRAAAWVLQTQGAVMEQRAHALARGGAPRGEGPFIGTLTAEVMAAAGTIRQTGTALRGVAARLLEDAEQEEQRRKAEALARELFERAKRALGMDG